MRLEMDKKRVLELDRLKEKLSKVSFFSQTDRQEDRANGRYSSQAKEKNQRVKNFLS